ncbi:sensor histidine kinase [Sphaerisporangium perillae]|uniref:sensor histidine kinase n=1 Tax=Sphaerisporangium perillae TaxID=2935860 RepID=UPI00200EFB59|nr:histidine kinase [Sphaerisporangium perillae]
MFGRVRSWGASHAKLVDLLFLVPLLLMCLTSMANYDRGTSHLPGAIGLGVPGYLAVSAALIAPLFWRRSRPVHAFAAVALISFLQWLLRVEPLPANLAVLVAMYSVASLCALRWAIAAGAIVELGVCLVLLRWGELTVLALASGSLFMAATWIGGIYANTRRRYLESLEERAVRAEHERDQQARIAAAAERARIARELHDVVAHNVSVMIVQADGAGYAIDSDPEQARRAVQTISSTGRQALAEMRRLVGVLRQDDASEEEYAPQPGVAELDGLVTHIRRSGLPVEYTVTGTHRDLPEGEQLVIYRIVQEALTNTLKHGGPGARARVEMEYGPQEIMLRVTDDGRGAAAPRSIDGHGLIGMRERVAMYEGSVHASPCPGGGFQVAVRLPVTRAA